MICTKLKIKQENRERDKFVDCKDKKKLKNDVSSSACTAHNRNNLISSFISDIIQIRVIDFGDVTGQETFHRMYFDV